MSMSLLWQFHLPGDSRTFGYLVPETVARMPWTSEFERNETSRTITLIPEVGTDVARSCAAAITKLLIAAQDASSFPNLVRWPGEKFPVLGAPFRFAIDRAIAPYFGLVCTGSQLTVFVREKGLVAGIWVARRSTDKPTYAGMLDNAAGGAIKHGETPFETILREAQEEIGIDAQAAIPSGAISWFNVKDEKAGTNAGIVEPGIQYVYDLEVDTKSILRPAETGIEWLHLLSVDEVKTALSLHQFKPSCACVMIDFFVRHGIITADNDSDFAEIVSRLHRQLPLPTTYPLATGQ